MRHHLLAFVLALMVGCTGTPPLPAFDTEGKDHDHNKQACTAFFPRGSWQFVHAITFTMQSGAGSTVMGVTRLNGTEIESALITVEGLTLFEAVYHTNNSFEVHRAVPPFDKPGFAAGLQVDVRSLFQPPDTENIDRGTVAGNSSTCRFTSTNGTITDIVPENDCFRINIYSTEHVLERNIIASSCVEKGSFILPQILQLNSFGYGGYSLKMTLISAEAIK